MLRCGGKLFVFQVVYSSGRILCPKMPLLGVAETTRFCFPCKKLSRCAEDSLSALPGLCRLAGRPDHPVPVHPRHCPGTGIAAEAQLRPGREPPWRYPAVRTAGRAGSSVAGTSPYRPGHRGASSNDGETSRTRASIRMCPGGSEPSRIARRHGRIGGCELRWRQCPRGPRPSSPGPRTRGYG